MMRYVESIKFNDLGLLLISRMINQFKFIKFNTFNTTIIQII